MKLNEFVDKIYCINLKHRKDKKKFIQKQAKKYNLDITYFKAVENKKDGWKGCLQSHLAIIREAKATGLNKILIIEDDCLFLRQPEIDETQVQKNGKCYTWVVI